MVSRAMNKGVQEREFVVNLPLHLGTDRRREFNCVRKYRNRAGLLTGLERGNTERMRVEATLQGKEVDSTHLKLPLKESEDLGEQGVDIKASWSPANIMDTGDEALRVAKVNRRESAKKVSERLRQP